jgi:hypothetical protein
MGSGHVKAPRKMLVKFATDSHLLNGKRISRPETITHISSMGKVSNNFPLQIQ